MEKIKIYFQHEKAGEENWKRVLEATANNRGIEALVETPGKNRKILPQKFDIYLLHVTEVSIKEVDILRKKQPKSLFYGIFGGGRLQQYPDFSPYFDKVYVGFGGKEDYDEIFETIKESRRQK